MPRYTRNTVILAKAEVTYGTDPTPAGATDSLLCSRPEIRPLVAQNVPRDLNLGFLGAAEHLPGSCYAEVTFDVELAGSGTAGTAPPFAPLLLACGLAETVTAVTRVDYTPVSSSFGSVTFYWYRDGLRQKLQGARGNVTFKMTAGGIPVMSFTFKGLYSAAAAVSNAPVVYTAFQDPLVVSEANTGDLTLGGTHTTSTTPAITGGTAYPSQGIEVMLNNTVEHVPLLGGESIELTQREPSCTFTVEKTVAQEVTAMSAVLAASTTTIGLLHGTTAGNKVMMWLPAVQRINPSPRNVAGKDMLAFEGRLVPTSGNDEFRVAFA